MATTDDNYNMIDRPWENLIRRYEFDVSPYVSFYKDLHQYPELSQQEYKTASKVAAFLQALDPELEIRTGIGGTGLFGVLKNGSGKTILLRADMDALPLSEKTGLEYASQERAIDSTGKTVSVMHGGCHNVAMRDCGR